MGRTEGFETVGLKDDTDIVINPSTEDTLKKLVSFGIGEFDQILITYVAAGDGAGEIETATYKLSGGTIATLTLAYNGDNKLSSITKT
jgi:hypothetical protein